MLKSISLIVLAFVMAASLSACGRRGPLEAPSASANPATSTTEAAPAEDKPFVLDGLIQ